MRLQTGLVLLSAAVVRAVAAMVAVWLLALARRELAVTFVRLREPVAAWAMLAGSFCGPFLGVTLSLLALKLTEAGVAASIIAFYPVITIFLAACFHRQRITFRMISGALVAVAGVVILFL